MAFSKEKMVNRCDFLKVAGITIAGITIGRDVFAFTKIQAVGDPLKEYTYRNWEDLYRKEWTWDKVGLPPTSLAELQGVHGRYIQRTASH